MSEIALDGLVDFYGKLWHDGLPLFRLLPCRTGVYLYDTGTNKILSCDPSVAAFLLLLGESGLDVLLTRLKSAETDTPLMLGARLLKEAIEAHSILRVLEGQMALNRSSFGEFRQDAPKNLKMLCLEVTDQCNLNCRYCVNSGDYEGFRGHGVSMMSWETAKKGIDLLAASSSDVENVHLSFYGGEPFLNFPLIQKCVEYASLTFDKSVRFALTTNATLMTDEIADFLDRHQFHILISIDGDKDIHDENRVYRSGGGTFDHVISNLKMLIDKLGREKAEKQITLHSVATPPFTKVRFERIKALWDKYPWLESISGQITSVMDGNSTYQAKSSENEVSWGSLICKSTDDARHGEGKSISWMGKNDFDRFKKIVKRKSTHEPIALAYPNACCVPGVRKAFVCVKGEIKLCERVGASSPDIGHVDTGLDYAFIENEFVDKYIEDSTRDCSRCWASKLCWLCYMHAYEDGRFSLEKKQRSCIDVKGSVFGSLIDYCDRMKFEPESFDHILSTQEE